MKVTTLTKRNYATQKNCLMSNFKNHSFVNDLSKATLENHGFLNYSVCILLFIVNFWKNMHTEIGLVAKISLHVAISKQLLHIWDSAFDFFIVIWVTAIDGGLKSETCFLPGRLRLYAFGQGTLPPFLISCSNVFFPFTMIRLTSRKITTISGHCTY